MATRAFIATLSTSGDLGCVVRKDDLIAKLATCATDAATAAADTTISGNATALTKVTTVQTDITAAQGIAAAGGVVVVVDTAVVTTKNQLRTALDGVVRAVEGSNLLS